MPARRSWPAGGAGAGGERSYPAEPSGLVLTSCDWSGLVYAAADPRGTYLAGR
jgi:hypothetical protein